MSLFICSGCQKQFQSTVDLQLHHDACVLAPIDDLPRRKSCRKRSLTKKYDASNYTARVNEEGKEEAIKEGEKNDDDKEEKGSGTVKAITMTLNEKENEEIEAEKDHAEENQDEEDEKECKEVNGGTDKASDMKLTVKEDEEYEAEKCNGEDDLEKKDEKEIEAEKDHAEENQDEEDGKECKEVNGGTGIASDRKLTEKEDEEYEAEKCNGEENLDKKNEKECMEANGRTERASNLKLTKEKDEANEAEKDNVEEKQNKEDKKESMEANGLTEKASDIELHMEEDEENEAEKEIDKERQDKKDDNECKTDQEHSKEEDKKNKNNQENQTDRIKNDQEQRGEDNKEDDQDLEEEKKQEQKESKTEEDNNKKINKQLIFDVPVNATTNHKESSCRTAEEIEKNRQEAIRRRKERERVEGDERKEETTDEEIAQDFIKSVDTLLGVFDEVEDLLNDSSKIEMGNLCPSCEECKNSLIKMEKKNEQLLTIIKAQEAIISSKKEELRQVNQDLDLAQKIAQEDKEELKERNDQIESLQKEIAGHAEAERKNQIKLKLAQKKTQEETKEREEKDKRMEVLRKEVLIQADSETKIKKDLALALENENRLQENLESVRDENVQLKNKVKLLRQDNMSSDIEDLKKEFIAFKKQTSKDITDLKRKTQSSSPRKRNDINSSPPRTEDNASTRTQIHRTTSSSPTPPNQPNKLSKEAQPHRVYTPHNQVHSVTQKRNTSTLRCDSNNPVSAENSPDEQGRTTSLPIVPGTESYRDVVASETLNASSVYDEDESDIDSRSQRIEEMRERRNARNRKCLVFGSSITRSIHREAFNKKLKSGSADIHTFKTKTARYIVKYMLPHIEEDCPHTVVMACGGNDIPKRIASHRELETIAGYLINGGLDCKNNFGVTDVYISSILPRVFGTFQRNRHILNSILREQCDKHGFIFIDNDNVLLQEHIDRDGIHLNSDGNDVFMFNLLGHLND